MSGELSCCIQGHDEAVNIVEFNPRYAMFASSSESNLGFWGLPPL
jgi:hypothetical protein